MNTSTRCIKTEGHSPPSNVCVKVGDELVLAGPLEQRGVPFSGLPRLVPSKRVRLDRGHALVQGLPQQESMAQQSGKALATAAIIPFRRWLLFAAASIIPRQRSFILSINMLQGT
jgi:hypothetical protein